MSIATHKRKLKEAIDYHKLQLNDNDENVQEEDMMEQIEPLENKRLCKEEKVEELKSDHCDLLRVKNEVETPKGELVKEECTEEYQDVDDNGSQKIKMESEFYGGIEDIDLSRAALKLYKEENTDVQTQIEFVNCDLLEVVKQEYIDENLDVDQQNLKTLDQIQIKDKPFNCEICDRKFSQKNHLTTHLRIHARDKPFQCEVCDRKFTDKSNFTRHHLVHTGDRPFECEVCNKKFTHKGDLTKHSRIHSGDKPFKCETCDQRFTQKNVLIDHIRVHTGDKPFKCQICDRRFSQKNSLAVHNRTHNGDKPFQCEVCCRKFTDKSNLNAHLRIHTGDKPYKCEICYKKFAHKISLTSHLLIHAADQCC